MKDLALLTAAIVFLAVALMHLLRVFFKAEIKIKNFVLPMWLSVLGFVVALGLSVWMLKASQ